MGHVVEDALMDVLCFLIIKCKIGHRLSCFFISLVLYFKIGYCFKDIIGDTQLTQK